MLTRLPSDGGKRGDSIIKVGIFTLIKVISLVSVSDPDSFRLTSDHINSIHATIKFVTQMTSKSLTKTP